MGRIDDRLQELGLVLPPARSPMANYVPAVQAGTLVFVAGQVSVLPEKDFKGKLGRDVTVEEGRQAARACALNALAVLNMTLGSLDRVKRIVRVGAFVQSADDFDQQPAVVNGASDLLVEIFGEPGKHARVAVGVNVLPAGFAVEMDLIAEVD